MEAKRFILLVSLGLVALMLWQQWQLDYAPAAEKPAGEPQTEQPLSGDLPAAPVSDLPAAPVTGLPAAPVADLPAAPSQMGVSAEQETEKGARKIRVKTDLLDLEIDLSGGTIDKALLLQYPISKNAPEIPLELLKRDKDGLYIAQSGLLSKDSAPNHGSEYKSSSLSYELADKERLSVDLSWRSEDGMAITKTYVFKRGSYLVDVVYKISNGSDKDWKGSVYGQLQRSEPVGRESMIIYTYTGAVVSSPENRYEKISFGDMRDGKLEQNIVNGWAAMLQHYFVAALIPGDPGQEYHYYTLITPGNNYVIGAISPSRDIAADSVATLGHSFYLGPKIQKTLSEVAEGLELTVDYGVLWFIAKPLFWLLENLNGLTNNWGWAIIILTILVKLVFYNLSAAGYRSMANMRRVQPKIMAIRDQNKGDRQRLNQAMMDLYKKEKINPLGGCFPILVQIPVFIALYWVLLESVEMRQADFALWITDLSSPDPYFVLPLVMGVTMFLQQKLHPAPLDPVQEKVMAVLPVVFTIFFAFFPSGLVLYWVVNNILSIAQQWLITKNLEKAGLKR